MGKWIDWAVWHDEGRRDREERTNEMTSARPAVNASVSLTVALTRGALLHDNAAAGGEGGSASAEEGLHVVVSQVVEDPLHPDARIHRSCGWTKTLQTLLMERANTLRRQSLACLQDPEGVGGEGVGDG